jgi:tetratricopeptide (TPR) repeat protein
MKQGLLLFILLILYIAGTYGQINSTIDRVEIDSLLHVLDRSKNNERPFILNLLSSSLVPLQFDSAYNFAQEALVLSQKSNDQVQKANAIFNLGNSYYYQNDLKNALLNYQDALTIMENFKPSDDYGNLLLQLGFIHYFSGSNQTAIDYYKQAVQVFEKTVNADGMMYSYRMIGIIFWNVNRCDSALFYDTLWLNHYKKTNNLEEYAKALSEVGEDLRCLKDTLALSYMERALEIAEQINDPHSVGLHNFNLALLYKDSSQFCYDTKKAETYFLKAIEAINKANRYSFKADFLAATAKFYLDQDNPARAKLYLNEALIAIDSFYIQFPTKVYNEPSARIRFQVDVKKIKADIYTTFLAIYKMEKNYKLALKYQELKDQAEDSVYADFVKNQFEFLEAKADNERKGQQIVLLSQKSKLQENNIRQSYYILIGVSILFIFIIVFIFLFIRQSRLKMTQDKLILEQKLLRTQMNPHFIFNSLASVQNFIVKQDDTKASIYLSRFSNLVRSILNNSIEEQITLEDEINTIENYLELQRIRFPEKFDFFIDVDEKIDPENTFVPPMLAQPFIENAIEHGIKQKGSKGNIFVRYKLNEQTLVYEVEDDGIGRARSQEILHRQNKGHKSLATTITQERIKVLNKKLKHKITLEIVDLKNDKGEAAGTRVAFDIPYGD